ncbi:MULTISPECIES: hypothetical protein [unclassified Prochlorococcus]|uniref:hypothetical protein n=1 Tax=unclassified Prochlorococcus TaxID=2627481 RepID=UPI000533BE7B|nr:MULTISPECIES: hypothetical protein [unclassified Prochlorococcus]KGG15007.1 hypothetical protein EV06_1521 [Prochlorococcus sp. MIT 0602]KGG17155.1 hypothetical protein EV07_0589 [Prochlorococcus sp. MIT 0603]
MNIEIDPMPKKSSTLSKVNRPWLLRWSEEESVLAVIPKSKTKRLAKQAQLANIDAEKAVNRAYQQELLRAKAISEAMFKSGKAVRYSLASSARQIVLRLSVAQRKIKGWFDS